MPDDGFAAALFVAASWVGFVSLGAGLLLVRHQTARGPPHPFTSAFVSGLLIGISCLVVLPEALDRLPDAGWKSSQVMLLFLGAAVLMFTLDHAVMEHQHVARGERLPIDSMRGAPGPLPPAPQGEMSAGACDPAVWKAKADEVPVWVRPSSVGHEEEEAETSSTLCEESVPTPTELQVTPTPSTVQAMSRDPRPKAPPAALPHATVGWCPCHGGDPFANGGGGFGISSFCPMGGGTPVCPVVRQQLQQPLPSPPPSPPWEIPWERVPAALPAALEEGHARTIAARQLKQRPTPIAAPGPTASHDSQPIGHPARLCERNRCQRGSAIGIRVGAWMLHATIDGMVLASAPSTCALIATALPVTLCALQDVAAFTVAMARLGCSSRRSLNLAVVALSSAFPLGALLSHAALESATSDTAVDVVRTVVAGVFTYMGLFEVAPPHTHNRAANAIYMLCFGCGVGMAYAIDVAQQLSAGEAAATAIGEALQQRAPNATLA